MATTINADTSDGLKLTADTSGTLELQSAGSTKVTIKSNGKVGIGGTPSEPLSVYRAGGQEEGINIRNTSSGNGSRLTFETTRSDDSSVQDMASIQVYAVAGYDSAANSDAIMTFQTQDSGTTAERMRIQSNGDVGIGISNPSEKLHVGGSGSTYARISSTNAASGAGLWFQNATATYLIGAGPVTGGSELAFYDATNTTERMRINSSGQLIIGGTSWSGGVTTAGLQIDMNTSTDATFGFLIRNGSNAESFIHKMNGSTFNTTGTFGTISDRRFKENIVDATSKLDEIKQLKVRNFNLIGEEEKYLGFIAQEIEQVFPNIVDTQAERTHKETDDDGNETTVTTPEKKLVKTTVLIPILTKALQEAVTKIEDLETRIEALENA